MVDCGEASQIQFMRMHFNFSRLRRIFISHLHGDHCYGLPGLLSTLNLSGCDGQVTVHLPEKGVSLFRPLVDYTNHGLKVEFAPYRHEKAVIYEDKAITVTTVPLVHRMPCVGFVFREKPRLRHIDRQMTDFYGVPVKMLPDIKAGADFVAADGRVIPNERLTAPADPSRTYAYISDTLPLDSVIPEVQGADLLYHEATYLDNLRDRARETCHSTALQAGALALQAGVRRLVIGHFSSRYLNESMLLDEARTQFAATELAREGMQFDV